MSSKGAAKHPGEESSSGKGKRKRDDVEEELEQIKTIYKKLETTETDFSKKATVLRTFYEAVSSLDRKCEERVPDIKRLKTNMKNAIAGINKMVSEGKILQASISKATIENVVQPLEESEELLCNIAHIYTTQSSPVAFIVKLLKASGSSVGPLTEVVRAVEELKEGGEWTVDSSNYMAALLALADQQPKFLILRTTPNEPKALSAEAVAAVATAAKGCEVRAHFVDSFLKPVHSDRDLNRLEHLTEITSLRLTEFYGHLCEMGVAKLPATIKILGLAINSEDDAVVVSNLDPWETLEELVVSVSSGVPADELMPLPEVKTTSLSFPSLKGEIAVGCVRPAIQELVGNRRFHLFLPDCQLTAANLSRLAKQLKGLTINTVTIQDSGDRLDYEEMTSAKNVFDKHLECKVVWDMGMIRLFDRQGWQ